MAVCNNTEIANGDKGGTYRCLRKRILIYSDFNLSR